MSANMQVRSIPRQVYETGPKLRVEVSGSLVEVLESLAVWVKEHEELFSNSHGNEYISIYRLGNHFTCTLSFDVRE